MKQIAAGAPTTAHTPATPEKSDINALIGWVLQGGVIVSSMIIALGTLLLLLNPANMTSIIYPRTFRQVWAGLLVWQPQAIIALGLLVLIATPVIRVAISTFAFARERDRLYVLITLLVLAILITSFMLGKGGA